VHPGNSDISRIHVVIVEIFQCYRVERSTRPANGSIPMCRCGTIPIINVHLGGRYIMVFLVMLKCKVRRSMYGLAPIGESDRCRERSTCSMSQTTIFSMPRTTDVARCSLDRDSCVRSRVAKVECSLRASRSQNPERQRTCIFINLILSAANSRYLFGYAGIRCPRYCFSERSLLLRDRHDATVFSLPCGILGRPTAASWASKIARFLLVQEPLVASNLLMKYIWVQANICA